MNIDIHAVGSTHSLDKRLCWCKTCMSFQGKTGLDIGREFHWRLLDKQSTSSAENYAK